MAQLFNISEWTEQRWWNTGGTRNKKIFLNPGDGKLYFFKQSFKRGLKDYKYEFWSEIIASEVGRLCGFDVLPYHLGVWKDEVGCLSMSMIDPDKEELIEGGKYLQAFDSTFNPDDKNLRHQYDFELLENTLEAFQLQKYYKNIAEMLVFDALIGNSDRHQENWALITEHSPFSKSIAKLEYDLEHTNLDRAAKWIQKKITSIYQQGARLVKSEHQRFKLSLAKNTRFAPIYDNGCSLGRELDDDRLRQMLKNSGQIDAYLRRGKCEIHWEGQKLQHFVFLEKLLRKQNIGESIQNTINRTIGKFKEAWLIELLDSIDVQLEGDFQMSRLPSERKQLIVKLVTGRLARLKELLSQKEK